jgi:hypothetical protein
MIRQKHKDAFWCAVEDCLLAFHHATPAEAHRRSAELRQRIESMNPKPKYEMIYHDEPFDVACQLVGVQLDIEPYRGQYYRILDCRGW